MRRIGRLGYYSRWSDRKRIRRLYRSSFACDKTSLEHIIIKIISWDSKTSWKVIRRNIRGTMTEENLIKKKKTLFYSPIYILVWSWPWGNIEYTTRRLMGNGIFLTYVLKRVICEKREIISRMSDITLNI